MKILKIMIVMLILIMSAGAVCAAENITGDTIGDDSQDILKSTHEDVASVDDTPQSFSQLNEKIANATGNYLELTTSYKFNSSTDSANGVAIRNDNFVLDGKGYTIDANNQARAFVILGNNITINNLTIINANSDIGSAFIIPSGSLTTNYVNIDNCSATRGVVYTENGPSYTNNYGKITDSNSKLGAVHISNSTATFNNVFMSSSKELTWGFIYGREGATITVLNSVFANTTSQYTTAIMTDKSTVIKNSKFINLYANFTAGAVAIKGKHQNAVIENCTFVNVTSSKNGGALFIDVYDNGYNPVSIVQTTFTDCYSGFGGAMMALGGNITIDDCNFTNNHALFDGGAIYTSFSIMTITNSIFTANGKTDTETGRNSYGGAIYGDACELNLYNSKISDSIAHEGSAIYLYDSDYDIEGNAFENNADLNGTYSDIYTVFEKTKHTLNNNNYSSNNSTSLNNKLYESIVDIPGVQIQIINNTIDVASLPSRFDLRDWGWVTPIKNQGNMQSCWAFATAGTLESAILRYLGISISLSENNIQDIGIQYSRYGISGMTEGGLIGAGGDYALGWFGLFESDYDVYDQLGKISPLIAPAGAIHIQDMVIIPARKNSTDNDLLKQALIKYGAVGISYHGTNILPYVKGASQYIPDEIPPNHGVTLIGWDDNYSKDNFYITPPGDGAWIIKNSWGDTVGDQGYFYISYYDTTFATYAESYTFIINNSVQYTKNYQADVIGVLNFLDNSTEYKNVYEAISDDLLAAVGTYFNQSGAEYSIEIYVNDVLRYAQSGVSAYYGYHTIPLDTFVPVKKGDIFSVKIKSNSVPTQASSRLFYPANTTFYLENGEWKDASLENISCVIKAYTVGDDSKIINNENVTADYGSGSYFSVKVVTADGHSVGAGAVVNITINGKTTSAITDANGIAKVEITEVPGSYEVATTYNGETYNNTIAVNLNPNTCKITQNKNIKVDYDGGKYFSVKIVSADGKVAAAGVTVKFKINGKTTQAKTDKNGIAKIKITDVPKKYTMTTTYNGKTVKNTVTVNQVLKTKKVNIKKTSKSFILKASLKINGKLQKGKLIAFKFNGKTYKVKTNKKGIAQKTLNKQVIGKLKKGKTYTVKVTYKKDTIKTTVKVR